MHIHQAFPHALEHLQGRGAVVDDAAARAVRGEGAADYKLPLLARGQAHFVEDRVDIRGIGEVEHGLRHALVGASPDRRLVGAFAEQQTKRADDDGFAGAGLTGNDVQSRFELDRDILDQREVPHSERLQHGRDDTNRGPRIPELNVTARFPP